MTTLDPSDFWSEISDLRAGLLAVGDSRPVPMSPYADKSARAVWFVTAQGTDPEESSRAGPAPAKFLVAGDGARIYGTIEGVAQVVMDKDKLDEIWNPVADAWFEQGKSDPDLRMIRMDLRQAELWLSASGARFFYEIAKAQITGEIPDAGSHGKLTF